MNILHRGSERRWLLTLAVIALVVRLGWAFLMIDRSPRFDEVKYIGHATRLAAGEGYVDEDGTRVAYWPVGYPALLSLLFRLTGPSQAAAVGLQIVLSVMTCLLLSVVGSRVLGRRTGGLAGLLLALYPTYVMYSTLSLTEPLFTFLLVGSVSALTLTGSERPIWQIAAGVLLGLATLTRPLVVLFPLLIPFGLRQQGRSWRKSISTSLVVGVVALVTISPWLWRNHDLTGRWTTLSTTGGINFWVGNNPEARGGYVRPEGLEVALQDEDGYDYHRGFSLGWSEILANPARALYRLPLKVSHLVALETDGVLWNLKGFERDPPKLVVLVLLLLANIAYVVVLGTAVMAFLARGESTLLERFTILLCVYMLAIVMVFFGDPRFHLPLMPFLLLFSSMIFTGERPRVRPGRIGEDESQRPRFAAWAGIMGALALLMVLNLAVKYTEGAW